MEKLELIYKQGGLFDAVNNKRVQFKENAKLVILANSLGDIVQKEDNRLVILDSNDLKNKIIKDKKVITFQKILKAESLLFFKIRSLDTSEILVFTVKLLEDLYLYKTKKEKEKEKFYDCACMIISSKNIKNKKPIEFFEEAYGKSLSELYHNTSIKYFGYGRTATTLVYTSFFTDESLDKATIIDTFRKNKTI